MSLAIRQNANRPFNAVLLKSVPARNYSRAATYRRIQDVLQESQRSNTSIRTLSLQESPLQAYLHSPTIQPPYQTNLRSFSTRSPRFAAQSKTEDDTKESQKKEKPEDQEDESSNSEDPEGENSKKKKTKQEDAPPPPPHGDKTPWQVFTETLSKEFKASKEWNESTKALASSANQFSESESVKKARAAYSAASDAASSKTSTILKSTGKAIGEGASWTWETPVMKGVRKGANAVGKGLDTATKPVRETAAFKSVKDVIDDGSSSRYGGWVEKEERRKARELRELEEIKSGKRKIEKMEEDPKYVHVFPSKTRY
jgi:mitochondrial import inner membrane translocase subunit TIM44